MMLLIMGKRAILTLLVFVMILKGKIVLALPEGAACISHGYPGTCMLWKKCFTMFIDQRNNKFPSLCSFDGRDPIICCTSCVIVDDVSKAVLAPGGDLLWKNDYKSWNKCMDYLLDLPFECKSHVTESISKMWIDELNCFGVETAGSAGMGGRDAQRIEFPHMALLGYGTSKKAAEWLCSGTIISDRFILTAAHCKSCRLGPVKYAALGILKRSDPVNLWQIYNIKKIIPYPKYRSPSKYHDIALLKTKRRIRFNENVLPACLPNPSEVLDDNQALATGWGATGYRTAVADTLQVVQLEKFNSTKCSQFYRRHRHMTRGYDDSIQLCYGDDTEVRDTCAGDSGGPLQVDGKSSICLQFVIGVTSNGRECGTTRHPGMYTRVEPYVPWIESIVWP